MGIRRQGQEGALAPLWKCCKVFCALVVTAKCSAYELFMHYFQKNVVGFWQLCPQITPGLHPWNPLGDFCPQSPNLPTVGKNPFKQSCLDAKCDSMIRADRQ